MAIGNVELVHKCFPKYTYMGTARMKEHKDTVEGEKSEDQKKYRRHKKINLNVLTIVLAYYPLRLLHLEAVDELPN